MKGILSAPGRRVAGVHIQVEVAPFRVVDRFDAEGASRRCLAVLDASGVVLLVLHRSTLLDDLAELVAGSIVHELDGIAGNVYPPAPSLRGMAETISLDKFR